MPHLRQTLATVALLLASQGIVFAAPPTAEVGASPGKPPHVSELQQLLKLRCVKCHNALHPKAELNLSTMRGVAKGGENGPIVRRDEPKESLLWQRVAADEMPPENPLSVAEKNLLRNWLEQGTPGLPEYDPQRPVVGLDHWAFQPLVMPKAPIVANAHGLRTPIDSFVQSHLEGVGLALRPEAERTALIRRVAFTLTGLPPTPGEIAAFLADDSPSAYEAMVDRYLASPRYGEHWGQFWLDSAGYADSSGYFSNERDRPLAWRYRDYVIASFNEDKPLAQFVSEQLAGDELFAFQPGQEVTPEQLQSLIATQFLANAPDGTDQSAASPEAMRVDRYAALEGTQEILASCLLGLTMKCARCHDHKFEPITQREYYQIQSVLLPALNPKDWVPPLQRKIRVFTVNEQQQWQAQEEKLKSQLADLQRELKATEELLPASLRGETVFKETFAGDVSNILAKWRLCNPQGDIPFPAADSPATPAARVKDEALTLVAGGDRHWLLTRQNFDWTPAATGEWIQVSFHLVQDRLPGQTEPAMRIGYHLATRPPQEPGADQGGVLIDGNPTGHTQIYLDPPAGKTQVLGVIAKDLYTSGKIYGVRITKLEQDEYRVEHMVDYQLQPESIVLPASSLPDGAFGFYAGHNRSFVVDDIVIERGKEMPEPVDESKEIVAVRKRLQEIRTAIRQLQSQHGDTPGSEICWVSDRSSQAPEVFVLKRGDYDSPTDAVQPGGLAVLGDPDRSYQINLPADGTRTTGRRLAFARWLTEPGSHPAALLTRVQVNRIWLHHFGQGLTSTAENFGLSGDSPLNPELLEYLAARMEAAGGKWKELHREILCSAVFRQASGATADALRGDPENRLYSRFPLRRLNAEQMRDALLAASGELDLVMGGPAVPIEIKGSEQEKARGPLNREVVVADSTPGAHRRSIYLQHKRTQIPTVLSLFGTPSLSTNCTQRKVSTIPLQSLTQLNSEFMRLRAAAMARRLQLEAGSEDAKKCELAFLLTVGRQPSQEERQATKEFLSRQRPLYQDGGDEKALADYCQMLLASNLFLYLE